MSPRIVLAAMSPWLLHGTAATAAAGAAGGGAAWGDADAASEVVGVRGTASQQAYDDDAALAYLDRRAAFVEASVALSAPYGTTDLSADEATLNAW
jgi:hypothetical protein